MMPKGSPGIRACYGAFGMVSLVKELLHFNVTIQVPPWMDKLGCCRGHTHFVWAVVLNLILSCRAIPWDPLFGALHMTVLFWLEATVGS